MDLEDLYRESISARLRDATVGELARIVVARPSGELAEPQAAAACLLLAAVVDGDQQLPFAERERVAVGAIAVFDALADNWSERDAADSRPWSDD